MSNFEKGQKVVVLDGVFKGCEGEVEEFFASTYSVRLTLPSGVEIMAGFGVDEGYLGLLDQSDDPVTPEPEPALPGFGLEPAEVVKWVAHFIENTACRVEKSCYTGTGYQPFEACDLEEILDYIIKETEDIAAQAAVTNLRVRRIQKAWAATKLSTVKEDE